MKVSITLEQEDLDAMHDVILEVTGTAPSNTEIIQTWEALPEHIRGTALQWGTSDTVFRDEMYSYLKKNRRS